MTTRGTRGSAGDAWASEDLVVLPDVAAADRTLDDLRDRYARCAEPVDGAPAQTSTTTEAPGVGDEAFVLLIDVPNDNYPESSTSVVVRQGSTVAMYVLVGPLLGDGTLADSGLQSLVEEFVAAASAQ